MITLNKNNFYRQHNYTIMPPLLTKQTLSDPTQWLAIDTVLYVAAVLLLIAILMVVVKVICNTCCRKIKQ